MGKNKKLRNGVDQVQNFCVIETDSYNQEIPEDFLTSDNFCIVQKKRGNKKFSDFPTFDINFQAQTNSVKNTDDDDDTGKPHTSFWRCKSSENPNVNSVANEFGLKSVDIKQEDCSLKNSEFYIKSVDIKQEDCSLKNSEFYIKSEPYNQASHSNNGISSSVKEFSTGIVKSTSSSFISNGSNVENLSLHESVVNGNVCSSKKKNKKKEHMKKYVDEEVEKILRELEIDDKPADKSKSNTLTASHKKNFQQLSHKSNSDNVAAYSCCISPDNKGKTFDVIDHKCHSTTSVDSLSCIEKIECVNLESGKEKLTLDVKDVKRSEKRKAKRSKAKQKTFENENSSKSNLCSISPVDLPSTEEVVNVEEKKKKSQNNAELDKRGRRPNKKQLAVIHEALKKAKEEEERFRKEEELKQKMAQELERIRQEKLKQEQEKKEKKKLKEKQRRQKMKAEGRLLSKSQKQSRARMEATLAALKEQGIDVPQICDKKPFTHGLRIGNSKTLHRKRYDSCQSTQSSDSAIVISDRQKSESFSSQESSVKDSLSDLPSSFDSTDELVLTPESDKGIFSCSEESDGLDENTSNVKVKKDIDSKSLSEFKYNKLKTLNENQVKLLECDKVNSVKYRSPVVCVLGHVDTGKTKLLDYVRKTHVQDSEAGGITQQIGATMIPRDALKEKCKMVNGFSSFKMEIPGLLVIDTPGHESFSNLRSRGSSICDIAVLVVDIMHGLQPQTIESINLLKKDKTPFIVVLNKVDRIYGWKSSKDEDIESIIKNQSCATQIEFKKRCQEIVLQFANQCLNATLFYENKDPRSYVTMVPTSAITGDGMGNVLSSVVQLTQSLMSKKLIYSSELEATVLEVKAIPGLGTTIDVILVNGCLHEGDTIVLAGQEGPIVTQIRSLLMPQSLKELRVKNPYIEYKFIEGAQGVKITGKDLEKTIAGLPIFVASNPNMVEILKDEVNHLFRDTINSIKTSERGVYVQASTLGSLEALLDFLSASGIPYFNVKIGPVVKKDVMKASIMLEHDVKYAAILAFDVKIERDAQELADSLGVHIFHADIIYHLFDMYVNYRDGLLLKQHEEIRQHTVFPCKLKILPEFILNIKDPIILGVSVEQGSVRVGTPLCIPSKDILEIGIVSSIKMNNNKIKCANKGDEIIIKIDPKPGEFPKSYGKHFSHEDLLVSRITRQSIDICKEYFRNELHSLDWQLIVELKKMLHIV